jgi:hypothetical protein
MTLLSRAQAYEHQRVQTAEVLAARETNAVNRWLALHVTRVVGTMWCAYAFALIGLVALPAAVATRNPTVIVAWVSSQFLQLVLLSIILVGQNVLAEFADQRASADHETLGLLKEINVRQLKILEALGRGADANA